MQNGWIAGTWHLLGEWWAARPRLGEIARTPRHYLIAVLGLAVASAASVGLVWSHPLVADATSHLEMAESFASTGTFRQGDGFSHFYPPVYPALLALPGALFGFTKDTVHAFQALLFALLTASAFFVGARFGRPVGLVASALCAADPVFLNEAGEGRATLLAALLLLWTFHFVLKGLEREAALGWAGLAAGVLYLTKDTTGFVALIGIAVGFLWRVSAMGLRPVLASSHYRLAGAFFVGLYGAWALRNLVRFGSIETNPSLTRYASNFFGNTDAGLAATMVAGSAALFAWHWLGWIWPALADARAFVNEKRRSPRLGLGERHAAVLLFISVTLAVSAVMAALFIRNEGNKAFPGSLPDYFRLIASSDPVLFIGVGLLVVAPKWRAFPRLAERLLAVVKVGGVLAILLSSWPGAAAHSEETARAYVLLGDYLEAHEVAVAYSEAAFLFAPNIPSQHWAALKLDFTGPLLNHSAAGVPDNATVVTIGWLEAPDYRVAGFYVILHFNRSNPPTVHNPFYAG